MSLKTLSISVLTSLCLCTSALADSEYILRDASVVHMKTISGITAQMYKNTNQIPYFESVKSEASRKAVIFVGGASDTFHFLDKYIELYKDKPVSIIGYEGPGGPGSSPFNVEYLDINAKYIANGIKSLKNQGIDTIYIITFSLGGVVTKKALLDLDSEHLLDGIKIDFVAISSPLGGFAEADPPAFLKPITKLFGYALSVDMNPDSEIYVAATKPFPDTVTSILIETKDDPVAQPRNYKTRERYESVASTFTHRITLQGTGVHIWAQSPEMLNVQGVDLSELEMLYIKYVNFLQGEIEAKSLASTENAYGL